MTGAPIARLLQEGSKDKKRGVTRGGGKTVGLRLCQPNLAISTSLPAGGPTVCKEEDVMIESRIEKNVKSEPRRPLRRAPSFSEGRS
jgi:hypothetical protein